ncbi:MAG: dihydrolipoamide acetyltransferase family protein [Acidimicrobiales bacterium]
MSEEIFLLPDVGEGLVEAEIVTWKVNVGDLVRLNQPLVDIETAKATVELPSPYEGTVVKLHGSVGDVMEVHKALITFEVVNSATDALETQESTIESPATEVTSDTSIGESRDAVLVGYGVANEDAVATRQHRRKRASGVVTPSVPLEVAPVVASVSPTRAPRSTPPVRLYAKQHGVNLSTLMGTGRDGLITRDDVERALGAAFESPDARTSSVREVSTTSRFVGRELASWSEGLKEERIPVKGVLRSMSDAMVQSAFSAPHAAVWVRLDATKTVELLASLKQRESLREIRLSPLTIVALALCDAARHFPGVNSSFDTPASEVIVRRSINLGVAADTPRGLIVPNIKGADQLDLVAMAQALDVLVEKARSGTTTPNEMIGTTLTITNVGPFGVDAAVPILPPGTGAILAVGRIAKAPWVVNDEVVVRHVVEIALSFDHRQIDGALASRVISHVARYLEDPAAAIIAG